MDIAFLIMDISVCEKDKEIRCQIYKLSVPSFFSTNIRKLSISFEISIIFPCFHLKYCK